MLAGYQYGISYSKVRGNGLTTSDRTCVATEVLVTRIVSVTTPAFRHTAEALADEDLTLRIRDAAVLWHTWIAKVSSHRMYTKSLRVDKQQRVLPGVHV